MKKRIITISREFGSGGRTIGRTLAEELGIPCYDDEILLKTAVESGLAEDFIKEHGEYTASNSLLGTIFATRDYQGRSMQDVVWQAQKTVIEKIGQEESCVIVGRCADYILKDIADCLTVFIHASKEFRAHRIVEVYGENETKPMKRLSDKDKRRKNYYQFYTDLEWGQAQHYDICLDSGVFGLERCVEILKELY